MPEHESAPTAPTALVAPGAPVGELAGGYPPMAALRGAVPGWPSDASLTSAVTPEGARAVLQAEAETSVLHAVGLRWGVVRAAGGAGYLVAAVWFLARLLNEGSDALPFPGLLLFLFLVALAADRALPWAWLRADPAREGLPPTLRERARLRMAALRGTVTTSPAAHWPAGSEAFALLATAAMTDGIDAPWLLDRTRLPATVGAQWLDAMARLGWLSGGDASFGRWLRRPVELADAGRERLEAERVRLRELASS